MLEMMHRYSYTKRHANKGRTERALQIRKHLHELRLDPRVLLDRLNLEQGMLGTSVNMVIFLMCAPQLCHSGCTDLVVQFGLCTFCSTSIFDCVFKIWIQCNLKWI